MFFSKPSDKKKTTVRLEGCLDPKNSVELCEHGFGKTGYCWECEQKQKQKSTSNRDEFFGGFGNTINLDDQ